MIKEHRFSDHEYYHDLEYCKQFIYSFGSSYSLATRLLKKEAQEATIFFYAFVRYADELVDNPQSHMNGQTHTNLDEFITEYTQVITQSPNTNTSPVIRSLYNIFAKYGISFDYTTDFLAAMKQDTIKIRYKSYAELKQYMWGSAAIVGHVMTYIVGYKSEKAFEHAQALGEAMQLANFLRDIDEDFQNRNRIYLPQDDMSRFGVTEQTISNRQMTPELRNLLTVYTKRTEALFDKGMDGIKYLKTGKFSILLASRIYQEKISILKKRNYDIFSSPIKVTKNKKLKLLISTFFFYSYFVYFK